MTFLKISIYTIISVTTCVIYFIFYPIFFSSCLSIAWSQESKEIYYIESSPSSCMEVEYFGTYRGFLSTKKGYIEVSFDKKDNKFDSFEIDPPIRRFILDNPKLFINSPAQSDEKIEFSGPILKDIKINKRIFYIERIKL